MSRAISLLTGILLGVAIAEAVALVVLDRPGPLASVPLVPTGSYGSARSRLESPGGTRDVALEELRQVGGVLTVEDVARGLLYLRRPDAAHPLTPDQVSDLYPLVVEAAALRTALLEAEGHAAGDRMQAMDLGAQVLAALSPEQRAAVFANRDLISVAGVEQAYWDQLLREMGAP